VPALLVWLVLLSLALPVSGAANSWDLLGFGSRAISLGGAQSAAAQGPTATYYNPAALAFLSDQVFEVEGIYAAPQLDLDVKRNNEGYSYLESADPAAMEDNVEAIRYSLFSHRLARGKREVRQAENPGNIAGVSLALGTPLPIGPLRDRLGFGLAVYSPVEDVLQYDSMNAAAPYFLDYHRVPQRIIVASGLGLRIWRGLSLGASIHLLAMTGGSFDFDIIQGSEDFTVYSEGDITLKPKIAPGFGMLYRHSSDLSFGASFRELIHVSGITRYSLSAYVVGQQIDVPLDYESPVNYSPRQLAVGVAYKPDPFWMLAFDLVWMDWSRYLGPVANVNLDAPEIVYAIGLVDFAFAPRNRFHDTFVPRFGVEHEMFDQLLLRGGYYFKPSPAPPQDGITNVIAPAVHSMSVGFEFIVFDWLRVAYHSQLQYLMPTSATKSPSKLNDEIGAAGFQSSNPGYPGWDAGGFSYGCGLGLIVHGEMAQ
jgi:long-chain fatty acid transport protein